MSELVMQSLATHMAKAGSVTTIEQLVTEHARLVYRICFAVSRNHHDAEDAAQEVFLRALQHQRRIPTLEDPKSWLARIAWRIAIDRQPKAPMISLSDDHLAASLRELRAAGTSAEEAAAQTQTQALLARMIASLPEELRAPLLLGSLEELNSREVAAALEIPETTVRVRQMRARQLLKEKLLALAGGGR